MVATSFNSDLMVIMSSRGRCMVNCEFRIKNLEFSDRRQAGERRTLTGRRSRDRAWRRWGSHDGRRSWHWGTSP